MPAKYRFVTNGDFVDFFDDSMLVRTFPTDYQGFGWYYDSSPGIILSFEGTNYQTDTLADFSFDDVPLASKGGLKTALGGLFPHYENSGGGVEGIERENDEITYTAVLHNFQGPVHINGDFLAANGIYTGEQTNLWTLGAATEEAPAEADIKIRIRINGTSYDLHASSVDD